MKVLICGECFSQNLGDGVIALSMKKMVKKVLPDSTVLFYDISGRNGYDNPPASSGAKTNFGTIRKIHRQMYSVSHCYTVAANVLHNRFLKQLRNPSMLLANDLASVDYMLIGGGQLLQDNALAFPLAVSDLVKDAGLYGIPVSFFSVGVGKRWSAIGKKIIGNALRAKNIESIICRDSLSADRLVSYFPDISGRLSVTYDAALAANMDRNLQRKITREIGLGITHPKSICSIDKNHQLNNQASAIAFWSEMYRDLSEKGFEVRLFSNGANDDDALARKIEKHIQKRLGYQKEICIKQRPRNPSELISVIGRFMLVVANRLHANIVATILGIPCIALGWDSKVKEFMKYSGQEHRFVHDGVQVSEIVKKIVEAMSAAEPKISTKIMVDKMLNDMKNILLGHPTVNAGVNPANRENICI